MCKEEELEAKHLKKGIGVLGPNVRGLGCVGGAESGASGRKGGANRELRVGQVE